MILRLNKKAENRNSKMVNKKTKMIKITKKRLVRLILITVMMILFKQKSHKRRTAILKLQNLKKKRIKCSLIMIKIQQNPIKHKLNKKRKKKKKLRNRN